MPSKLTKEDAFQTLGVVEGATEAEIKAAYKKLALKHHPDKNPNDENAEARFLAVSGAFKRLTEEEEDDYEDEDDEDYEDYEDAFDLFAFMFEQQMFHESWGHNHDGHFYRSGRCSCGRGMGHTHTYVPPPPRHQRETRNIGPDPLQSPEAQAEWLRQHGLSDNHSEGTTTTSSRRRGKKSKRAQKREHKAREQKAALERQERETKEAEERNEKESKLRQEKEKMKIKTKKRREENAVKREKISTLKDMGFEYNACVRAIELMSGSVELAATMLLEEQDKAGPASPPSSAAEGIKRPNVKMKSTSAPATQSKQTLPTTISVPLTASMKTAHHLPPTTTVTATGTAAAVRDAPGTVSCKDVEMRLLQLLQESPEGIKGESFGNLYALKYKSNMKAALDGQRLKDVLLRTGEAQLVSRPVSGLPIWYYKAMDTKATSSVGSNTTTPPALNTFNFPTLGGNNSSKMSVSKAVIAPTKLHENIKPSTTFFASTVHGMPQQQMSQQHQHLLERQQYASALGGHVRTQQQESPTAGPTIHDDEQNETDSKIQHLTASQMQQKQLEMFTSFVVKTQNNQTFGEQSKIQHFSASEMQQQQQQRQQQETNLTFSNIQVTGAPESQLQQHGTVEIPPINVLPAPTSRFGHRSAASSSMHNASKNIVRSGAASLPSTTDIAFNQFSSEKSTAMPGSSNMGSQYQQQPFQYQQQPNGSLSGTGGVSSGLSMASMHMMPALAVTGHHPLTNNGPSSQTAVAPALASHVPVPVPVPAAPVLSGGSDSAPVTVKTADEKSKTPTTCRVFVCPWCEHSFYAADEMKDHYKTAHS